MIASLVGITMAFVLQQGDEFRQHLQQPIICIYTGDESSVLYSERHSGKFVTGVQWSNEEQYHG